MTRVYAKCRSKNVSKTGTGEKACDLMALEVEYVHVYRKLQLETCYAWKCGRLLGK